MFSIGTEYPTSDIVRYRCNGANDGMTRISLKIFEVSQMKRRNLGESLVTADGALRDDSRVASEYQYICLNRGRGYRNGKRPSPPKRVKPDFHSRAV